MIRFEIPGPPLAWSRAGAVRTPHGVRMFTKAPQSKRMKEISLVAKPWFPVPLTGAVRVRVEAYFDLPASRHRVRNPVPTQRHTSKPDADNIAKLIEDSLNGIAWVDDAQVAILEVEKWWCAQGERSRVVVLIEGLT